MATKLSAVEQEAMAQHLLREFGGGRSIITIHACYAEVRTGKYDGYARLLVETAKPSQP
jgi:hypothetical protein